MQIQKETRPGAVKTKLEKTNIALFKFKGKSEEKQNTLLIYSIYCDLAFKLILPHIESLRLVGQFKWNHERIDKVCC